MKTYVIHFSYFTRRQPVEVQKPLEIEAETREEAMQKWRLAVDKERGPKLISLREKDRFGRRLQGT